MHQNIDEHAASEEFKKWDCSRKL